MLKNKNLIIVFMLLFMLAATPMIAAEKGSGLFQVPSDLRIAGVDIDKGEYKVQWEAAGEGSEEAEVQFKLVGTNQIFTVKGTIEEVSRKYNTNNIGIALDSSGQRIIKQLQFGGKKIRIVF